MQGPERGLVDSNSFKRSMFRAKEGVDAVLNAPEIKKAHGALEEIFSGDDPLKTGTQLALIGLHFIPERALPSNVFADTIVSKLPATDYNERQAARTKAGEVIAELLKIGVIQPDAFSREMNRQAGLIPRQVLEEGGGCYAGPMLLGVEFTPQGAEAMEKIVTERDIEAPVIKTGENLEDLDDDDIVIHRSPLPPLEDL